MGNLARFILWGVCCLSLRIAFTPLMQMVAWAVIGPVSLYLVFGLMSCSCHDRD